MTFPRPDDVASALGVPPFDPSRFFEAFYRTIRALDDLPRPHPPDIGLWWWTRWLRGAGVPGDVLETRLDSVAHGNMRWIHRREGVVETLTALRDSGVRLAVVSNAGGRVADELEEIGVRDFFETVVDSHLVGVEKPDRRIFEIALHRMDVMAGESMHVGDVWSIDVVGARAAGITPVHLDPLGLYDHDEHRIARLEDLPALAV